MTIHEHATVGDIAASRPEAIKVFQELGIDYCCGGKRTLKEVLGEANATLERFAALVEAREAEREAEREASAERGDFTAMSPAVLSAYIEDTHHEYLRRVLPEIGDLLLRVLRAHGANHRELYEVYPLFGRLKSDLEQHLIKEETLLFPALAQGEAVAQLAGEIVSEHEVAGELLRALRAATGDYAIPEDACPTYERAYAMLPALEQDLHQHIHLENNVLLKEVVA